MPTLSKLIIFASLGLVFAISSIIGCIILWNNANSNICLCITFISMFLMFISGWIAIGFGVAYSFWRNNYEKSIY